MTDRYAVIGNPIVQSKSPLIHSAFAQVTGQDIDYDKLLGPLGEFAATVDAFRASGGRGMNVTAPFKLDAFAYATDLAPSAQMAGSMPKTLTAWVWCAMWCTTWAARCKGGAC
jgi:shikimate dehydrogenase